MAVCPAKHAPLLCMPLPAIQSPHPLPCTPPSCHTSLPVTNNPLHAPSHTHTPCHAPCNTCPLAMHAPPLRHACPLPRIPPVTHAHSCHTCPTPATRPPTTCSPVNRMTDTCENFTFLQLLLRTVIMTRCEQFLTYFKYFLSTFVLGIATVEKVKNDPKQSPCRCICTTQEQVHYYLKQIFYCNFNRYK